MPTSSLSRRCNSFARTSLFLFTGLALTAATDLNAKAKSNNSAYDRSRRDLRFLAHGKFFMSNMEPTPEMTAPRKSKEQTV